MNVFIVNLRWVGNISGVVRVSIICLIWRLCLSCSILCELVSIRFLRSIFVWLMIRVSGWYCCVVCLSFVLGFVF